MVQFSEDSFSLLAIVQSKEHSSLFLVMVQSNTTNPFLFGHIFLKVELYILKAAKKYSHAR